MLDDDGGLAIHNALDLETQRSHRTGGNDPIGRMQIYIGRDPLVYIANLIELEAEARCQRADRPSPGH